MGMFLGVKYQPDSEFGDRKVNLVLSYISSLKGFNVKQVHFKKKRRRILTKPLNKTQPTIPTSKLTSPFSLYNEQLTAFRKFLKTMQSRNMKAGYGKSHPGNKSALFGAKGQSYRRFNTRPSKPRQVSKQAHLRSSRENPAQEERKV